MRYKLWIFPTYIPQTDIHFGLLLQGDIQVIESAQFGISVNISGKSTYELSSVHIQYTAINDTILLQVVREGFDQLQKEELSIWLRSPMVPLTIFLLPKSQVEPAWIWAIEKWLDETVLLLFTWPSWKWHSFTHLFYSSILTAEHLH